MQRQERSFSSLPDTSCVQLPTELLSHRLVAGHNIKDPYDDKLLVQY